ncbi:MULTISPECIES: phospholipase D family protein [unclassified Burkholderia]|uniref:phospholipase D family nuclease n=1 Tax=unclassified Burkholderia TaxID=2613784 RepID=UPI002AB0A501|nr:MULTISPECIES: phospholipase D family protein [unclassified Burkholderia]
METATTRQNRLFRLTFTLLLAAVAPSAVYAWDVNPFSGAGGNPGAGATLGGTSIEVGFSPSGHAMDLEIKAINSARRTLDIAAYEFTSKRVSNAVRAAIARGVRVRVACDAKENVGRRNSIAYPLAAVGAQVRFVDAYPIMHDKLTLVDRITVETGSLNYTAAADLRNRENALVIWNNPQLAGVYEQDFEDLFSRGHPLTAAN